MSERIGKHRIVIFTGLLLALTFASPWPASSVAQSRRVMGECLEP